MCLSLPPELAALQVALKVRVVHPTGAVAIASDRERSPAVAQLAARAPIGNLACGMRAVSAHRVEQIIAFDGTALTLDGVVHLSAT